jgi:hypothetical protein
LQSKETTIEDENEDEEDWEGNIKHSSFNIEHRSRAVLEAGVPRTST